MGFLDRLFQRSPMMAAAQEAITAAYQGAAMSFRTSGRDIWRSGANTEVQAALVRLRDVHRDFVRNNPYAARAVSSRVTNTVGAGIEPSVAKIGPNGQALAIGKRRAIMAAVKRNLHRTAIDYDGRTSFSGLQALIERARSESGEALIVRYRPNAATMRRAGLTVPLQIRVLEGDYLDHMKNGRLASGNVVVLGVEFNSFGQRVAYWLHDVHPGERLPGLMRPNVSQRVPAEDVIHYYHVLRPGQVRGVPDGTPVFMTLWDGQEYEDARLLREKIAACFSVFFTRSPTGGTIAGAGQERAAGSNLKIKNLAPGLVQELPAGAEVTFGNPPTTQGHNEYVSGLIRRIAVGYDCTYEEIGADLTKVSFLSGRLGELHQKRRIDQWQWHWFIPSVCHGVAAWFGEALAIVQRVPEFDLEWTPPAREMLSPKDEIPAVRDAIRAGLTSRSAEIRKRGEDPEQVDNESAEDNARADLLKLSHDSDGRKPRSGPSVSLTGEDVADQPGDDQQQDAAQ